MRHADTEEHENRRRWVRIEATSLSVLTLIALATWGFFALSENVHDGPSELDRSLLLALRSAQDLSDPLGPVWFEELVRDLTALGGLGPLVLVSAVAMGYLALSRRRRTALLLGASVAGGVVLSFVLKDLFDRDRPDVVPHLMRVSSASFPSGHAMLSTVVYVTLGSVVAPVQRGRLRLYAIVVAMATALLVGCSRIYLGVHWPSDVVAGFAIGGAWAGLAWLVERRLQRSGAIEPEPPAESQSTGGCA